MTLQWTIVAGFLYCEIALLLLFMLPWIRAPIWQKIFRSRLVRSLEQASHILAYSLGAILFLLFGDAIREVHKYSMTPEQHKEAMMTSPNADVSINMRLFRAQRNLYIAGFALLLWLVIRRMVQMISKEARLSASAEAAVSQARSAAHAAKQLIENKPEEKEGTEVEELKEKVRDVRKELELALLDRDTMKKQADAVKDEYDRLMKEYTSLQEEIGDKKDD